MMGNKVLEIVKTTIMTLIVRVRGQNWRKFFKNATFSSDMLSGGQLYGDWIALRVLGELRRPPSIAHCLRG